MNERMRSIEGIYEREVKVENASCSLGTLFNVQLVFVAELIWTAEMMMMIIIIIVVVSPSLNDVQLSNDTSEQRGKTTTRTKPADNEHDGQP